MEENAWLTEEERKERTLWLFEEESFVPAAMIKEGRAYSILTDHLGTPTEAYDADGNEVWSRTLDMNGKVIEETGNVGMIPFLFQGQYHDRETELAYNRFRYYSPQMGMYISQDPIGLAGGIQNLYGYVDDTNARIDAIGLQKSYSNTRRMTEKELDDYFGKGWHRDSKSKKKLISKYRKELKGSTNVDIHIEKDTHEIILVGNKSNARVATGDYFP